MQNGIQKPGVPRNIVGFRDVAGGVDILGAGHQAVIDADPFHVTERETRLEGQL